MADLVYRSDLDRPLTVEEADGNIAELAARNATVSGQVETLSENQNNTTQIRTQFWPYETPPSEADVVGYINEYSTFTVLPTQSRVWFKYIVQTGDSYSHYWFDFGGGNGVWGAPEEGTETISVPLHRIKLVSILPVLVGDIEDGPETAVIPLGDIFDIDNFLGNANGEERDFTDPNVSYYFSYYVGDILYLALFIGELGVYGEGATPFVDSDFAQVTNSDVQPIPTLQQVNDGAGTSNPLMVYGVNGKLAHEHDLMRFGDNEGNATKYYFDPNAAEPENIVARMGDVIPRGGTVEGFPVEGDIEIINTGDSPTVWRLFRRNPPTVEVSLEVDDENSMYFKRETDTGLSKFGITPANLFVSSTEPDSQGLIGYHDFTANAIFNPLAYAQVKLVLDAIASAGVVKADLVSGKVPSSQLPSYVDDVLDGTWISTTVFNDPLGVAYTPESGKVYVDTTTNRTYRWGGSAYVSIKGDLALGSTSTTAHRGDHGTDAYTHSQQTGNPHGTAIADISGLSDAVANLPKILHCNTTAIAVPAATITETILGSFKIPAGSGDGVLSLFAAFQKGNSNGTVDVKFRLHTSVAVAGTQIALFTVPATHRYTPLPREFSLNSSVVYGFPGTISSATDQSTSGGVLNAAYNTAVDNYIIVTATMVNSADTFVQKMLKGVFSKTV